MPGFFWSRRSYRALARKIADFRPAVVHVHNTFPQLSPSVFWAASGAGVAVMQTLHNFRHVCANSTLLRGGRPAKGALASRHSGARYGCYAGSQMRTAAVAAIHSCIGAGHVPPPRGCFIALNGFSEEVFRRANFPAARTGSRSRTLCRFAPASNGSRNRQAVFAGTISHSKGVPLLLDAWRLSRFSESKLVLIGDGPERESLTNGMARTGRTSNGAGKLDRGQVLAACRRQPRPGFSFACL